MNELLRKNKNLIVLISIWLASGIFFPISAYIVIPLTVLLLYKKDLHSEIFIGLFVILTLSDSRLGQLSFAADVKNIYIVMVFFITLKFRKENYFKINIYFYFIAFILIAFYCLLNSPTPFVGFQKSLSYIILIYVIPNYFSIIYKRDGELFIFRIVSFVFVLLFLGVAIGLINPNISYYVDRYRGLLGNPNGLGIYVFLFIIFFSIVVESFPYLFSKNQKILVYILSYYSLIFCGSRSSLFAVLIFFVFKKFYKMSPWVSFLIFISATLSYELITSNIEGVIYSLGIEEYFRVETLKNGSGRLVAWEFAWENISKNFFFGRGFNYTEHLYFINFEKLNRLGHQGSAHNSYLTIWLDTGLVGLSLFLTALLTTFLKASKINIAAIPVLYAVLFSNQFESWISASLNPFTIQMLIIVSFMLCFNYYNIERKKVDESEENTVPVY